MIDDQFRFARQRVANAVRKCSDHDLVCYHNLAFAIANGNVDDKTILSAKRLFEQAKREAEGGVYVPPSEYTPHATAAAA